MGLPKGTNNGNHGKKGRSGRKSAYEEERTAELLREIFFEPSDIIKLKNKVKSGKYSAKDLFTLKALEGDTRILISIINKIFSEKAEHKLIDQRQTLAEFLTESTEER